MLLDHTHRRQGNGLLTSGPEYDNPRRLNTADALLSLEGGDFKTVQLKSSSVSLPASQSLPARSLKCEGRFNTRMALDQVEIAKCVASIDIRLLGQSEQ